MVNVVRNTTTTTNAIRDRDDKWEIRKLPDAEASV